MKKQNLAAQVRVNKEAGDPAIQTIEGVPPLTAGLREPAVALPSLGRSNSLAGYSDHWVGRSGKSFTVGLHTERRGGVCAAPVAQGTNEGGVRSQKPDGDIILTSNVSTSAFSASHAPLVLQHAAASSLAGLGKITARAALAALAQLSAGRDARAAVDRLARGNASANRSKATRPNSAACTKAKKRTPTMGGLFIIAGLAGSMLIAGDLSNRYLLLGLGVAAALTLLGAIDDL